MKRVIHKFPLTPYSTSVPFGNIIKIGIDPKTDEITAWVERTGEVGEDRIIYCIPTGMDFDEDSFPSIPTLQHVETVIVPNGLVWHFYVGSR
jgi:hypothetical protein